MCTLRFVKLKFIFESNKGGKNIDFEGHLHTVARRFELSSLRPSNYCISIFTVLSFPFHATNIKRQQPTIIFVCSTMTSCSLHLEKDLGDFEGVYCILCDCLETNVVNIAKNLDG